ncbi:response regulator [Chimaeribacter californicus]|uniref:Response regulator n=1 Tax=Chimaeribacter californicus TaxID=2060067 RepID=A0A2N5DW93_9GAMM|nr:response regulator [Chimaeribacter californicus]PLR31440.1 response regulator [Chimaeribacter californicus]
MMPPCIAIIDDERSVRSGLSNLLQSEGYRVAAFASAEDFLHDSGTPAIILAIIDVKLAGMSGFDLFDHLARYPAPPPVIFISGHGDEQMERAALDLGAVAFLRKPINIDTLLEHIQRVPDRPDQQ